MLTCLEDPLPSNSTKHNLNEEYFKKEFFFSQQIGSTVPQYQNHQILPEQSMEDQGKITLCLDLDETLISSTMIQQCDYDFHFKLKSSVEGERCEEYFVKKRPNIEHFLRRCSEMFEVVVFTASLKPYADKILDELDPRGTLISHRLYRDSCSFFCGSFVKDLSLLNRDLNTVLLIDDLPASFQFHPENGLQIPRFEYHLKKKQNLSFIDNCLVEILKILETIFIQHEVISIIAQYN
ncbi:scp1-like small phosphatase 4-related [Anaeramoeba flamelloides]|uniref:Scp1-like small phosphatase 4-related n=1 Tax=Anaeramoeba flamelloides TaxID=1746091 RepID=A0AAV7ZIQ9_9EUKA|nr:scp1-like small phosphatase 4-related [Anaeramoeba flamelloides]KAJ6232720.1 scp1-like small phosphatase 4-related [Anaeramoeba flamelloides]